MQDTELCKLKQSKLNVLWDENKPLMTSKITRKGGLINSYCKQNI